ncbi:hypothetical protein BDN70DRAFT_212047 [Pholiota conissans]|uniref:Uncharacterized protein n=1 Tax=Pholiota conissans TaxID=109636 RepID=A0A9P5ZAN9_9AGAR|nr:hypothetical protein BDN70DRAFT_212047 [Pholiota conissans]
MAPDTLDTLPLTHAHTEEEEEEEEEEEDEEFIYPASNLQTDNGAHLSTLRQVHPSPAQLESLYAAASSNDLPLLKRLFRSALENGEIEPFSLANDASTRTGFTALHAAASRGFYDMTVWLIEDCGAMPDLEDREGEVSFFPSICAFLEIDKDPRRLCIKQP